jgi:hypothetical protein
MSTWSKARQTFGQGVPQTGERFDQSAQLRQMQSTVESAAPGSRWIGAAASAYGTANTNHGKVFGELASLDQRLSTQVTESAQVVSRGRQNLDTVRRWVLDAAAAVPAGKTREQMLMPIVQNGLGQITAIVTTSNTELNRIGGAIKGIGSEYQALSDQKFAPKEGEGDIRGVVGEDEKHLKPEGMEELARKTLAGDEQAAAKVDEILHGIDDQQLGPNSEGHPLNSVQAELVGQMQAQMSAMSMAEVNAARDRLGDKRGVLTNALQVMSNPNVLYPRYDGDGSQVVPSAPGGALPNDGVLPGDTGALPDGVQQVLNERGDFNGPPDPAAGYPGTQSDYEGAERQRAADNLKNLADIVGDGDSRFQQGKALDREMMSNAKEWLAAQESPDGKSQEHWGDEVVERVFDTAGRDTVVNHDLLTGDKDFMQDVLTHEWQDNGQSASTLTDWISADAYSPDPAVNERAGQTASAIADYLGDPDNKNHLMNNTTGSQANLSIGQMNPELTQSLANAMSPYVDEMAGRDLDGTSGWRSIDGDSDVSYPHATNVFGVLGTDTDAARTLDTRSASVQGAFINEYANSVIDSNVNSSDSAAMEAAGRLKGITDQGAFMAVSDVESDATKARQTAWDRMANNYDAAVGLGGALPYAGPALELQSTLMKDAILGPRPEFGDPGHAPIENSLAMKSALASTFMAHNIGDPADLAALSGYDLNGDGQLDLPSGGVYDRVSVEYQRYVNDYFNGIGSVTTGPLAQYEMAYRDALR